MPKGTGEQRDLAVVDQYPGVFRAGVLGRVAIVAWIGRLETDSAEQYARFYHDFIARLGGGRASFVHLCTEGVALPSSGARATLAKLSENSDPLACVSVVIEGSGFWASAVRGFLTGMRLLGAGTLRIHEHSTVADVVAWLPAEHEKITGERLEPEQLAQYLAIAKSWQTAAAA